MKSWDIRQREPIFSNSRFKAGVTSVQSNPHVEHLLAVGSYDNTLSLFDVRNPLNPLGEVDVGGGAWRVKWHPSSSRKDDLLAACMHDGVKVVRFDNADCLNIQIVQRFDAHASMAYGIDWSFDSSQGTHTTVASCSFYDHICCIWDG